MIKLTGFFVTYHIAKFGLWHYGYGAHFFHRTRYLSIPIYAGLFFYLAGPKFKKDLESVDLFEYYQKRKFFDRHT